MTLAHLTAAICSRHGWACVHVVLLASVGGCMLSWDATSIVVLLSLAFCVGPCGLARRKRMPSRRRRKRRRGRQRFLRWAGQAVWLSLLQLGCKYISHVPKGARISFSSHQWNLACCSELARGWRSRVLGEGGDDPGDDDPGDDDDNPGKGPYSWWREAKNKKYSKAYHAAKCKA